MDYKESGVDRDLAATFVESLKHRVRKTSRAEVLGEIGDFGAFFEAPKKLKDPIWVTSTDGVGTKLLLAEEVGGFAHRSVGQDVVAMCVNDIVACRAEPIVFLDYLATGKLEPSALENLLTGIVEACFESGCTLAGGETAQMPNYYPAGRYDVAGFSIGVLERANRLHSGLVEKKDLIFGLPSEGFHSNGFSLIRNTLKNESWALDSLHERKTLAEQLLTPTRLYVKPVLKIAEKINVHALAHITGGGLQENLPRGVDESKVRLVLQKSQIPTSALMKKFVEAAKLTEKEAYSTWNMGIGFCLIVPESARDFLLAEGAIEIGYVEAKTRQADDSVVFV